ncbi:WD40-repeat-containing domain [Pseudocohnilembus persalinus]|uniref:WD40-repeat-containing domain n=1 Tax=Pseudocohnilembus persalinus TaxID=266149 RepID=A0A0V0QWK1_PSEPJ|nr:WD40-repeat-containing domain [Pseudocohnilembus persalinus]|eukprot:KRX06561.1 WD40-repeat-containing domain [Pseudocohnilembus persalinus]
MTLAQLENFEQFSQSLNLNTISAEREIWQNIQFLENDQWQNLGYERVEQGVKILLSKIGEELQGGKIQIDVQENENLQIIGKLQVKMENVQKNLQQNSQTFQSDIQSYLGIIQKKISGMCQMPKQNERVQLSYRDSSPLAVRSKKFQEGFERDFSVSPNNLSQVQQNNKSSNQNVGNFDFLNGKDEGNGQNQNQNKNQNQNQKSFLQPEKNFSFFPERGNSSNNNLQKNQEQKNDGFGFNQNQDEFLKGQNMNVSSNNNYQQFFQNAMGKSNQGQQNQNINLNQQQNQINQNLNQNQSIDFQDSVQSQQIQQIPPDQIRQNAQNSQFMPQNYSQQATIQDNFLKNSQNLKLSNNQEQQNQQILRQNTLNKQFTTDVSISDNLMVNTKERVSFMTHFESSVNDMIFIDEDKIATCSEDSTVKLWEKYKGKFVLSLEGGHNGAILCLSYNISQRILVSGGEDGSVAIWRPVPQWQLVSKLKQFNEPTKGNQFLSNNQIVSGSSKHLSIWNVGYLDQEQNQAVKYCTLRENLQCFILYQQNKCIVAGAGRKLLFIEVKSLTIFKQFQAHDENIQKIVAFQKKSDQKFLVTCGLDKVIKIWDGHSLELIKGLREDMPIYSISYHQKNDLIYSSSLIKGEDNQQEGKKCGKITIWNYTMGRRVQTLKDNQFLAKQLIYDPFNNWIYSGHENGSVDYYIYDEKSIQNELKQLKTMKSQNLN